MKSKLQIIGIIVTLSLVLTLIIVGEIKVQQNWDKYEQKVFIERGVQ